MNFLRKFIGSTPTDEIAALPSGKLFLTRAPRSPKGSLECLYNDAFASIRQTTRAYLYQLCICKVYQEGELPDNDSAGYDSDGDYDHEPDTSTSIDVGGKTRDEWTFSIVEELQFRFIDKTNGTLAVSWVDVNGDVGDSFEFVIGEEVKAAEVAQFKLALFKCVYEAKYHKTARDIRDIDQLDEFVVQRDAGEFITIDDVKNGILEYNGGAN